jgi:hypothetical protein
MIMDELGLGDEKDNDNESDISYSGHSYFEEDEHDSVRLTLRDTGKGKY